MDNKVRQTLFRLGAAYALAWACTSMAAGPGSATLVRLTGKLSDAGLYMAIFYLGAAAGAAGGGRAMDRFGRKWPLVIAYLTGAVGYLLTGVSTIVGRLPLFVLGTVVAAAAFGTINLTRVSAADMFVPAERGRGMSWIQISAIFGAVTGPILLFLSGPLGNMLGRDPLSLVWFLAPPLLLGAAFVVSTAIEPRELAVVERPASVAASAAAAALAGQKRLIGSAAVALAASQTAMAVVMGVTGAAVSHAGHGVNVLGPLMFMHFVGMFGLSRLVGSLADRLGRRATILIGLGLLASGGAVVAGVDNMVGLSIGLLLVGFGWSFGFVASSVLLADATTPLNRARVVGRADLAAQLTSALAATGGGWWFAQHGLSGLGVMALVIAILPIVPISLLRESSPGKYEQPRKSVA